MEFALDNPAFWIAVLQIIAIDILLGGDNAVVIALACRNLPPELRRKGIFWGVAGAIGLRVVLTIFAVSLLAVPYLKLVGAVLLLWIGIKLILPEDDEGGHEIEASTKLVGAIKTIIVADAVMSLDNVIAVAAAAQGSMALLMLGLAISIPLVIFGSTLMIKLMERFPIIIMLGAALIGWVGGETIASDVALRGALAADPWIHYAGAAAGAFFVIAVGRWQQRRAAAAAH